MGYWKWLKERCFSEENRKVIKDLLGIILFVVLVIGSASLSMFILERFIILSGNTGIVIFIFLVFLFWFFYWTLSAYHTFKKENKIHVKTEE